MHTLFSFCPPGIPGSVPKSEVSDPSDNLKAIRLFVAVSASHRKLCPSSGHGWQLPQEHQLLWTNPQIHWCLK